MGHKRGVPHWEGFGKRPCPIHRKFLFALKMTDFGEISVV